MDTYHNTSPPKSDAKAKADPRNVGGGGAFGAFVSTDRNGMATTEASSAAKLNVQPTDNSFQDFVIDYNGDKSDDSDVRWTNFYEKSYRLD